METLERLAAADLVAVVMAYRDALRIHQAAINRLNVYPVPDGDTGTNMALTLESVVTEMADHADGDLAAVSRALSHGSLMGARGNSGVILSQILRGLAGAFAGHEAVDVAVLREGLLAARDGAYRAVQDPVEGTILSVVRAAAEAGEAQPDDAVLGTFLDATRAAAYEALARTPEQLPVLAAAGVVDSGGSGFVLLLDAFLHVTAGRALPDAPKTSDAPDAAVGSDRAAPGDGAGSGLRYEVMYLLEAADAAVGSFRQVWAGIGDSIVVVGGEGLYNCHIHTDDVGAAVEAALDVGRPRQIRVSDLWDQVEEERWVREAAAGEQPVATIEPVACAVVAVCTGDGVRRIFHSLGVSQTVTGGQSMNPSTSELLDAIDAAPASEVVLLSNNKNIVPVAEQAARQATKVVHVVATRGIPEGFAALLEYDPEADAAANATTMAANAARVVAGEITRAVWDASSDAGPIAAGDYLGLTRAGIAVVAPEMAVAATRLLGTLIDDDHHEIATVITGEGATTAATRQITEWLDVEHPEMVAEVHHGGQPLYPYLFSIE